MVEDELGLGRLICRVLNEEGYEARLESRGDSGLAAAIGEPPTALILDVALPVLGGLEVCRTLPLAFSAQVVSVTVAPDRTVDLALNSGLTVVIGTDTDLNVKYQDVASIIAHASLKGVKTIDVTVPGAPTVS